MIVATPSRRAGNISSQGVLMTSIVAIAAVAVVGGLLWKLLGIWTGALGILDEATTSGRLGGALDPADLVRAVAEAAPAVAEKLREHTFQAVEQEAPLLGTYACLHISANEAPAPNRFVVAYRPGGKAFVFTASPAEWERFRAEERPKIGSDREAFDAALWYAGAREPQLTVIGRLEELPFLSRLSADDAARLREGLQPPTARTASNGWEVSLCALRGSSLRRYKVAVKQDARLEVYGEDWIQEPAAPK